MTAAQKEAAKGLLAYIAVFAAVYYLAPIPPKATQNLDFYRTTLLMLNPLVCFIATITFSARRGFVWYFPLVAGGLFGPSIPIFYDATALVYLFAYIVLGYIGSAVGYSVFKDRANKRR